MNSLLNNRVGKPKKSRKRGCLFLVAGSVLALLGTVLVIFLISLLTGEVIEARHGDEVAYALMTIVKPCYGIVLLLFYGILAVWYMSPTKEEEREQKKQFAPMLGERKSSAERSLPRRTLWIITAAMAAGIVITSAVCVNTYQLVTEDGIRTYCFFETRRYEWKQVSAYTVDCDSQNGLAVTFTMRDGRQYEILRGVNSATDAFLKDYTSVTHFATMVDQKMDAFQIPPNIKHYERAVEFYKDYEGLWPYVAELIEYRDLNALPDETVPETKAPSGTAGADTVTNS